MNLPKFPHSAMFVGVTACGKTEFLLRLLETVYNNHFEFIVILCPTILDNKTYLSRKWIFDDKNVKGTNHCIIGDIGKTTIKSHLIGCIGEIIGFCSSLTDKETSYIHKHLIK